MADYGPGYDPSQADYISAEDQAIGGLIAVAALASISIVVVVTVETGTVVAVSPNAQAVIMAMIESGEFSGAGLATLETLAESWSLQLDAAAIAALLAYDTSAHANHGFNIHIYLDYLHDHNMIGTPGGGGPGGNPPPPVHGGWVCYTADFGDGMATFCFFSAF